MIRFGSAFGFGRNFCDRSFDTSVTFFVGENGSGKSTLLEGIARVQAPAVAVLSGGNVDPARYRTYLDAPIPER